MTGYAIFETAHGYCGIAWGANGIMRFRLPDSTAEIAERNFRRRLPLDARLANPPADVEAVIARTRRYFTGEQIDFSDVKLDIAEETDLFRRIYGALRRVPYGGTTTYGTLAKELGEGPEVARDVGQAMASNPVPLIIPCHRVLAAGGRLHGFSAPGGLATKRRLLEIENARVGDEPDLFDPR